DEADAELGELTGAADRIAVEGIAALDDQVAALEERPQGRDGLLRRVARGHHAPRDARRGQGGGEIGERGDLRNLRVVVEADHLVPVLAEALRHVPAHPAQPDHSDLHGSLRLVWKSGSFFRKREEAARRLLPGEREWMSDD